MESLVEIRKWVVKPSLPELAQCSQPAMQGDAAAQQRVCGALLWTAFAAPEAVTEIYDAIATGAVGDKLESALWNAEECSICLLYTSPSPRDVEESRMPTSA